MINKNKIGVIFICCFVSWFMMLTTARYFSISYFRWVNGYAITFSLDNRQSEEKVREPYVSYNEYFDVRLSIYKNRFLWFIDYPCYTTILTKHTEDQRDASNWHVLEMTNKKGRINNHKRTFEYQHGCG